MSKALQVLQLMGATPCDPNDGKLRKGPSPGALFYEWNGLLLTMGETYFRVESYIDEYHSDEPPEYTEVMTYANELWEGMKAHQYRVWQEVEKFKNYFKLAPFTTTLEVVESEHILRFYIKRDSPRVRKEDFVAGFSLCMLRHGSLKSPRNRIHIRPIGPTVFPSMETLCYEEDTVQTDDHLEGLLVEGILATWFSRLLNDENGVYAILDEEKKQLVVPVKYAARFFGYMRQAVSVEHSEIVSRTTVQEGEKNMASVLFPYVNANVAHKVFVVEL